MKLGDLAECAVWIDGTETTDHLKQWKTDCSYIMANGHDPVLKLGPVSFEIKYPGQDRVPPVPDRIKGPDVRLLIATAEVVGFEIKRAYSFVSDLDKGTLARLRAVTRKQMKRVLTDDQCDQIIERVGPGAAVSQAVH